MKWLIPVAVLLLPTPAYANSWEDHFTRVWPDDEYTHVSKRELETIPAGTDVDADIDKMWRQGYALIGFTQFNTDNASTSDAKRFATKLGAKYLIVSVARTSATQGSIPLTLPSTTTTTTTGTASVFGSGGLKTGTFAGTTTTTGTQTTYIPLLFERFDKVGLYFGEVSKEGMGILLRELTPEEVTSLETRRAMAVLSVRDYSPAYYADILPGDIITHIDDAPADRPIMQGAKYAAEPLKVRLVRNGQVRQLTVEIPAEWRATRSEQIAVAAVAKENKEGQHAGTSQSNGEKPWEKYSSSSEACTDEDVNCKPLPLAAGE